MPLIVRWNCLGIASPYLLWSAVSAPSFACEEVLPHHDQLLPPAAQMDDASWDKLFTTATLTDYQAEDVVRALPGTGWGRDGACVSLPRLGVL